MRIMKCTYIIYREWNCAHIIYVEWNHSEHEHNRTSAPSPFCLKAFCLLAKYFQPCSSNSFSFRNIHITEFFVKFFYVCHELLDKTKKKYPWKYFKRKVFARQWLKKGLKSKIFWGHCSRQCQSQEYTHGCHSLFLICRKNK
jgi:hypothetical protein